MKTYLDCLPCMMQQALNAGRAATDNEYAIKRLLDKTASFISSVPMDIPPPEIASHIYRFVKEETGNHDAYKHHKALHIKEALALYSELQNIIAGSDDPLLAAVRLSIAGNVIDLGVHQQFNILEEVKQIVNKAFGIDDYQVFKQKVSTSNWILYIGDNSGESVFDRLLIQQIARKTIYIVRDVPVINDVTYDDAIASGLADVAEIRSSGCSAPGLILDQCTEEFVQIFDSAPMVIAKGQGNYEGLSQCKRDVFFLLKAKCHVIARDLAVQKGDIVLKYKK